MATLLLAEVTNGRLNDITAARADGRARARRAGRVLVAGAEVATPRRRRAKLAGVAKVKVAEDAIYAHGLAEPLAALIVALAPGYDAILAASSPFAKNVLPRVAALLDVMQLSDISKVLGPKTFERPIYAGNAIQTVESTDPKVIATVRTASFAATPAGEERADRAGRRRGRSRPIELRRARRWRSPTVRN